MDKDVSTITQLNLGVCIWAKCLSTSPRGETDTWAIALRFEPEDLTRIKCEYVGWLLHTMFCITGVLGYFEQAVQIGDDGKWVRVSTEDRGQSSDESAV